MKSCITLFGATFIPILTLFGATFCCKVTLFGATLQIFVQIINVFLVINHTKVDLIFIAYHRKSVILHPKSLHKALWRDRYISGKDKGYAIPYEADGRQLTKCGVTISLEARNITHWRAVDKDGKVIDEQKFWTGLSLSPQKFRK